MAEQGSRHARTRAAFWRLAGGFCGACGWQRAPGGQRWAAPGPPVGWAARGRLAHETGIWIHRALTRFSSVPSAYLNSAGPGARGSERRGARESGSPELGVATAAAASPRPWRLAPLIPLAPLVRLGFCLSSTRFSPVLRPLCPPQRAPMHSHTRWPRWPAPHCVPLACACSVARPRLLFAPSPATSIALRSVRPHAVRWLLCAVRPPVRLPVGRSMQLTFPWLAGLAVVGLAVAAGSAPFGPFLDLF